MDFEGSHKVLIILIYKFFTMKWPPFQNFLKFAWKCILFLYFFLNERNIATSFLMIHLKCTVLHYANLNSSSISKLFLNYRPLNMLFYFSRFLIYVYFNDAFVKNFMKKLSFLNTNFHNCRILGCQTL